MVDLPASISRSNALRIAASRDDPRQRASDIHLARLAWLGEVDPFPWNSEGADPGALIVQACPPPEPDRWVPLRKVWEELRADVQSTLATGTRLVWNQDGVTFASQGMEGVDEAVSILRWGAVELFSRRPMYRSGNNQCISPSTLEERIAGAIQIADKLVQLQEGTATRRRHVDLSLLGVAGSYLTEQRAPHRRSGVFDRDHIYLAWTLDRTEESLQDDIAPLFDAVCQAGGMSGSPNQ